MLPVQRAVWQDGRRPVKVPLHIVKARRARLASLIDQHGYVPVSELCRRLQVSEATARRDLAALADEKRIKRTYGGAISEFDNRFPSFGDRVDTARRAKTQIASAAVAALTPGLTLYLDSGTTLYAIAEAFRDRPVTPLTIVTPNIPVAELLAAIPGVGVHLLAGQWLPRLSTLLGEATVRSLQFWRFDLALFSAEGMDAAGIWNSQSALMEQQKAAISRSARSVFCIDSSKLNRKALDILLPWRRVEMLLTDAPLETLREAGIDLSTAQYWNARGGDGPQLVAPKEHETLPVALL